MPLRLLIRSAVCVVLPCDIDITNFLSIHANAMLIWSVLCHASLDLLIICCLLLYYLFYWWTSSLSYLPCTSYFFVTCSTIEMCWKYTSIPKLSCILFLGLKFQISNLLRIMLNLFGMADLKYVSNDVITNSSATNAGVSKCIT